MRRRVHSAGFALGAIFAVSVVARIVIALHRQTPLYYPDEYIYTSLARSISSTGIPTLRGVSWHFPAFLAPYLMAPAWWISDVKAAYHVDLVLAALCFSAVVFPAYGLARRLRLTSRGSIAVGLFAVLVPDVVYASTALSEPYAYPAFVTAVLIFLDGIAFPTVRRQVAVLGAMAVLCLLRAQFVVLPVAYFVTVFLHARGDWRRALRAQTLVAAPVVFAVAAVLALGPRRIAGFYSDYLSHGFSPSSLAGWFGLELFVLLLAAGWVIAPSAASGLVSLVKETDAHRRVFGLFTVAVIVVLLVEATYPATVHHRAYERYVFYAVPLVAIAAVYAVEQGVTSRAYPFLAYALAIAAVLVPATEAVRASDTGQSPSLLWLHTLAGGGSGVRLVWALGLALAAVAVAQLRHRPSLSVIIGLVIVAAVGAAATRAVIQFDPLELRVSPSVEPFEIRAPSGAALVTWPGGDQYILMKTLFWSPHVDRVLVLGGNSDTASDGFPATLVKQRPSGGVVEDSGAPVRGPFAFDVDTSIAGAPSTSWLEAWPKAFIQGLDRESHLLDFGAQLFVDGSVRAVSLRLMKASAGRLTFICRDEHLDVNVGPHPRWMLLRFKSGQATNCRISLTRGEAVEGASGITSGVKVLRFAAS